MKSSGFCGCVLSARRLLALHNSDNNYNNNSNVGLVNSENNSNNTSNIYSNNNKNNTSNMCSGQVFPLQQVQRGISLADVQKQVQQQGITHVVVADKLDTSIR
jgi:hypothetical protein